MLKSRALCNLTAMVVMIVLSLAAARRAHADAAEFKAALDLIPADAQAAVIIPNITTFHKQITLLTQALGLGDVSAIEQTLGGMASDPQAREGLADMVALRKLLTEDKAIRTDGPAVLVLGDLAGMIGSAAPGALPREPEIMFVLPVNDYAGLVKALKGDPAAKVALIQLGQGEDSQFYARKVGDVAVIAGSERIALAYEPGKVGDRWLKQMGAKVRADVEPAIASFVLDIAAAGPTLRPLLKQAQDSMTQGIAGIPDADQRAQAEQGMANAKMMMALVDATLRDADVYAHALRIDDLGLAMTHSIQFRAGTPGAKLAAASVGVGNLLNALPNRPYFLIQAMNLADSPLKAILIDFAKQAGGAFNPMGFSGAELLQQVNRGASVMYATPMDQQAQGKPPILTATVTDVQDSAAYVKLFAKTLAEANKAGAMPKPGQVQMQATYTPNAVTIDGIKVDGYTLDMQLPPEVMNSPVGGIMQMLGASSQDGYIAALPNRVIALSVKDEDLLKEVIASVKANNGLGSDKVLQQVGVAAGLDKSPGLTYLSITPLAQQAAMMAPMFGKPAINVPANLPPIAVGVTLADGAAAVRVYAPLDTLRVLGPTVSTFMGMFQGMGGEQPQQGRRGPGGPPPR